MRPFKRLAFARHMICFYCCIQFNIQYYDELRQPNTFMFENENLPDPLVVMLVQLDAAS